MATATRSRLLAEMGIKPVWRLRGQTDAEVELAVPVSHEAPAASPVSDAPPRERPRVERKPLVIAPSQPAQAEARPAELASGQDPVASMDWDALEASIRSCTRCGLHRQRKQAVPGVGDRSAKWLFVGEGPGAEEDAKGEPFVGAAGKLLDAMLAAMGKRRGEDVYIANAVKCRPPGNRTPEPEEIRACLPFLHRQIELLQPGMIMALGRPAAQSLLEREIKIGPARGKRFDFKGIPVVVSYHPAYLLRTPADKARAWEDMCFASELVESGGASSAD